MLGVEKCIYTCYTVYVLYRTSQRGMKSKVISKTIFKVSYQGRISKL